MTLVAIDGPGGSGKSTVARTVAARLGLDHLDTGAMYRAVTWAALRDGVALDDGPALGRLAGTFDLQLDDGVIVDGTDVTEAIRGPEVTAAVSQVSAHTQVRVAMVRRQRQWAAARGGGVVEGRDIGSVVFPHAEVKVFLTASEEERARRRAVQVGAADASAVAGSLAERDRMDSIRAASPMVVATDAVVLDTTDRDVDQVVEEVLALL
ncbi:MAG TPA: (d)CMP kinase [Acidimicrobiales bacterium]|nr:(d)CMP kinase [Acidimicrobiales bacterium]